MLLDEFSEFLASTGLRHNERLVICSDFNFLGANSCSCDDGLMSLLKTVGFQQLVKQPTRPDLANDKDNLLELLIVRQLSSAQASVDNTQVVSSHDLSDHSMVVCEESPSPL